MFLLLLLNYESHVVYSQIFRLSLSSLQNQASPNEDEILQMFHHYDQVCYSTLYVVQVSINMMGAIKVLSNNMKAGCRCTLVSKYIWI